MTSNLWKDPRVALHQVAPGDYSETSLQRALASVAGSLEWGDGAERPFSRVIPEGARVLVKPNWVYHRNHGSGGIEPLITHASLVRVVAEAALASGAGSVTVGDAPLQSCDFDSLLAAGGFEPWARALVAIDVRFLGVQDFRRTRSTMERGVRMAFEDLRPLEDFVLVDLADESLLEPISRGNPRFRVTQYDPRLLERRHHEGRHQYLIARHALEADVVINLPKLKTHKKAGITCALKNLIGINGNKEFLPHHRLGGSREGGDCYEGGGRYRLLLEQTMDRYNMASSWLGARGWRSVSRLLARLARSLDGSNEIEGAWYGNDTIWRTCLDINRILLYGRVDGTMAEEAQREEIHIIDAITAGEGDGPLSPEPLPLGLLMASGSAAASDWVGSLLLHYDPARIPITREAFGSFRWPLTVFSSKEVEVVGEGLGRGFDPGFFYSGRIMHPEGWMRAGR